MKILIIILSIIGGIVALVLITAAFVKKEYTVEREILIDKPVQTVFDYVRMLKNQENYSVWVMQDPNQKTTLTGVDGTKGAIFSWNGDDQAGEGEQEIKDIAEGQKIEQEIRFKRPFKGLAQAIITTEPASENQTKVKWSFSSAMPYPINIMSLIFNIEGKLGGDMEKNLSNLKSVLEK